jgi:hypothetical protein
MDHYDVLTPYGAKRTWGPFTAYCNVPESTELFWLIDGDLYDVRRTEQEKTVRY